MEKKSFQVVLPVDLRARVAIDAEQHSESMATIIRLRLRERYQEIDAATSACATTGSDYIHGSGCGNNGLAR